MCLVLFKVFLIYKNERIIIYILAFNAPVIKDQ